MTGAVPTRTPASRRQWAFPAALVAALGLWNNVLVHRVSGTEASYVVVNGAATAVLLALARRSGLTWAELGLSRRRLAAGLRWGGSCSALVALVLAVAVAVPVLRPLLTDARTAGLDAGDVAVRVLVRIPLGTVVWEEVAFRGVLLAALARVLPLRLAVAVAAVLFGLWHIRPTLSGLAANDLVDSPWPRSLAVLGACASTAGAGGLFSWLRLRSGSLLAPGLLHLATNTLGTVAAVAAHRLG